MHFSSLLYWIFALAMLALTGLLAVQAGESALYGLSLVTVITAILLIALAWLHLRDAMNPLMIFLIAQIMFCAGHALLIFLGEEPGTLLYITFPNHTIIMVYAITLVALLSFGMGMSLAPRKPTYIAQHQSVVPASSHAHAFVTLGWLFLIFGGMAMAYIMTDRTATVLETGYLSAYQVQRSRVYEISWALSNFFYVGAIFLIIGNPKHSFISKLAFSLVMLVVALNLFTGHRSQAFMPLISLLFLRHIWVKPISHLLLLIAGGVMIFFVIPVMALIRNVPGAERLSLQAYLDALDKVDNPFLRPFLEMGSANVALGSIYELVKWEGALQWGKTYFLATLATIIPTDMLEETPGIAVKITEFISQDLVDQRMGLGSNYIAEAYFNFHYAGVVLVPMLLGYILMRASKSLGHIPTPYWAAFWAITLLFLPVLPRSESMSTLNYVLRYGAVPLGMVWMMSKFFLLHDRSITRQQQMLQSA